MFKGFGKMFKGFGRSSKDSEDVQRIRKMFKGFGKMFKGFGKFQNGSNFGFKLRPKITPRWPHVEPKMTKIGQNGPPKKPKTMKISKIYTWGAQNDARGPKIHLERLLNVF